MLTFCEGHFSDRDAQFVANSAWRRLSGFVRPTSFDGYHFVHHWAEMQSYDKEARQTLVNWGKRVRREVKDITVILAPHTKPLVKMGAQVGTTLLNVVGVKMSVEYDYTSVVERLGLKLRRAA